MQQSWFIVCRHLDTISAQQHMHAQMRAVKLTKRPARGDGHETYEGVRRIAGRAALAGWSARQQCLDNHHAALASSNHYIIWSCGAKDEVPD
jgi:hypothetical protein